VPILTDQERLGTLLGERYRIESILGRGGMGVVFKAREETRGGRPVAVKILRPELAQSDPQFAKRFVREAKAAAAIRHPNVVEVYDVGEDSDGTTYQVLQLLEGEPLRDYIQRKGRLDAADALEILLPVMHALEAAHAAGIVHRDLKPDNIYLARQPSGEAIPTLLDFGIAKLLDTRGGSFATNTGSIMGTPAYMAPEQASGAKDQGPPIDIWAMGIIAYECLSGAPPFTGGSPAHVMLRIMTEAPRPLDAEVQTVPAPIARAVEQALARAQPDRHPSIAAFRRALRDAAAECGVPVPDEGRPSTTRVLSIAPPSFDPDQRETADTADPNAEGLATVAARLRKQREEREQEVAATQPAQASQPIHVSIDLPAEPAAPARRWPVLVAVLALIVVGAGGIGLALGGGEPDPVPVATPTPGPTPPPPVVDVVATDTTPTPPVEPPSGVVLPEEEPPTTTAEATPAARPGRPGRGRRTGAEAQPAEPATMSTRPPEERDEPRSGRALPGVVGW
jgi:serine/threonine-protein kinase